VRIFHIRLSSIILLINIVSLTGISLLAISKFSSTLCLLTSLIIWLISCFLIRRFLNINKPVKKVKFNYYLLIILFIGFLFRLNPSIYLSGAQDQGLYISMSHQFEKNGSLDIPDTLMPNMNESQLEIYEKYNPPSAMGVSRSWTKNQTEVMPFYPLHPMWMSLFAYMMGDLNRSYSIVFFSIMSIFILYKLTTLLTKDQTAPYLAALLLAINPLHVFLSKFPVTENVALFFSLTGFYYFLLALKKSTSKYEYYLNLTISALTFFSFFFVRMSGFLYIPFFLLLLTVLYLSVKNQFNRKGLIFYFSVVFTFLALSNLYFLIYLPELFFPLYETFFYPILGNNWIQIVSLLIISLLISFLITIKYLKKPIALFLAFLKVRYKLIIICGSILVIGISFYQLYKLGYSENYSNFVFPAIQQIGQEGLKSLRFLPLYTILLYLSPFGFLLLLFSFWKMLKSNNKEFLFIYIFTLIFFIVNSVLFKYVQYHYYYARYYMTEIIPSLIIMIAISWEYIKNTLFSRILITASCCYLIFFSLILTIGVEGSRVSFFNSLRDTIDYNNNLILVDGSNIIVRIVVTTPIRYFYDYRTFLVSDFEEVFDPELETLKRIYKNIYLLSENVIENNPKLILVNKLSFEHSFYTNGTHTYNFFPNLSYTGIRPVSYSKYLAPTSYATSHLSIYIYKLNYDIE
jgi:hypothetical protein